MSATGKAIVSSLRGLVEKLRNGERIRATSVDRNGRKKEVVLVARKKQTGQ